MVAMIGLGVGIDYALFIVTRYREGLRLGLSVEESVVEAMDTSGRAVLFAGITVIISLMGLTVIGLSFVSGMAVAASIGVLMMILGSLTLLPALLGWVGTRIDNTSRAALIAVAIAVVFSLVGFFAGAPGLYLAGLGLAIVFFAVSFAIKPLRKLVPHRAEQPKERRFWYRWSRLIQRRPWPSLVGAAGLLILLALPLFAIRLGFGDLGNQPESQTVRRAYDLLAEGFGPGYNGPVLITVQGEAATDRGRARPVRRDGRSDPERGDGVPDADQRQRRPRHLVPGERAAGRRDDDAGEHTTRRRHPSDRRRRQGGRLDRGVDRLLRLPRPTLADG